MKYLPVGSLAICTSLMAIFAVGCCGKPEGEILTVEGYVVHRECRRTYDSDFWVVSLTIVQNPEKSTGKWWEPANHWRSEDGLTKYLELEYYISKDIEPKVQEGNYYIIRYRERDPYNRAIISARRPMKRNRKIQARIQGTIYEYNNAEKIPVPREIEKIPAPRVKTEVGSSYFWPTYDAPEQLGIRQFAVTPFRVQAVRVVPTRTVVINNRRRSTLLFR